MVLLLKKKFDHQYMYVYTFEIVKKLVKMFKINKLSIWRDWKQKVKLIGKLVKTLKIKQSFAWYDVEKLKLRETRETRQTKAVRQTLKINWICFTSFLTKRVKKSNREDDFGRRGD